MGIELETASKWITAKLAGDSATTAIVSTRIYADSAPEGADYPFIRFEFLDAPDERGLGTTRIATRPIAQIEVWTKGPLTDNARTVLGRIDALFQTAVRETLDGLVFSSRRLRPTKRREEEPGKFYMRAGGHYQLHIHATNLS